ncbi:hypothetical protein Dsin_026766 [Dipteronia sinensis]|uniref:Reverse transcriptase n=1 Tax=Dipteronia sinensis TaxID=43782 RepID=A0AAD9ZYX1_9ROSI|nr:hypothetical protein Dsin_026766 [Dipteronia sinensis]
MDANGMGSIEGGNRANPKAGKWKRWARDGSRYVSKMETKTQLGKRACRTVDVQAAKRGRMEDEDSEKMGGIRKPRLQMDNFRSALDDCGLGDMGFLGPAFRWCNERGGSEMVHERLDCGVCNFQWRNIFLDATVSHLVFWKSDHRPLLLDVVRRVQLTNRQTKGGTRHFHFKECWTDQKECEGVIKKAWRCGNDGKGLGGVVWWLISIDVQRGCRGGMLVKDTRISENNKSMLDAAFTAEKVRKALFDMHPSKALGIDERMSHFRPISLCNVLYNIIAKAIANRLRLVLGDVISKTHRAFIPGRLITDNAIVGFECMHALKRKKKGKTGAMALKLDMSKAYNRVEWPFLASDRDCRAIKLVLECYTRALGQEVNFHKSAMCVSSKVSRYRADRMARIIGVQLVGCNERYLGLPSFAVLKNCYFPDCSVMQANCGKSCSFLWRSFMWGMDLLKAGARWRMGNGESIFIYKDQRFPRPSTFKPITHSRLDQNAKPEDAQLILALPQSQSVSLDSFMWHYDKMGTYSVKSGYHLGLSLSSETSFSGLDSEESWWKFLWCIQILAKVFCVLRNLNYLCMVLWRSWFRCNGMIRQNKLIDVSEVMPWASYYIAEYKRASNRDIGDNGKGRQLSMKWCPPIAGKFKMNTDAAIQAEMGINMAKDVGLWPSEVEVDAQNIVHLIESSVIPFSKIGLVIKDIKLFLENFPTDSVAFVPRSANMVAHHLAKLGLSVNNDCFWLEECPSMVVPFVLGDCPSLI